MIMALFSQRYGHTAAEQAFQREIVSPELRTALWNVLKLRVWDSWTRFDFVYGWKQASKRINDLIERMWTHLFNADVDDLPEFDRRGAQAGAYDRLKAHFFGCKWYEVFDFIEFMAKDPDSFISSEIAESLNETLERMNSAT